MKLFICRFCGRETNNAGGNAIHENRCSENPNPKPVSKKYFGRKGHNQFTKAKALGLPMPPGTSVGKPGTMLGKKHSEKTKKKLSEIRKKYIEENPDKAPYVLNHKTKGPSYPERYWKKVLTNAKIRFEPEHRIGVYSLDFANLETKVDLEIDGEQHYCDERIVDSDKRRTKFLKENGWKVIRVRWSEYMKLDRNGRKAYVKNILEKFTTDQWLDGEAKDS